MAACTTHVQKRSETERWDADMGFTGDEYKNDPRNPNFKSNPAKANDKH